MNMIYIVVVISCLLTLSIIMNGGMYLIYKAKLPFFEQYRINPDVILIIFRLFGPGNKIDKNGLQLYSEA